MIFRLMMVTGLLLLSMGNAYADNSDAAWQQAKSSNSIESLRAFIRKHPGSQHLAEAGKALYKQSIAANKLSALSDFYEEFSDFPQAADAKIAYQALLKKQTGLDIRHTFHQGKIGTLYVPSVTNSYPSTTTHYINGHAINETTYHDSSSGGYNSDRYGYTAVYQIFNNSDKNYIVTVRASGTSTMSEMGVSTGSWSGEQSTYTNHNSKHFSQETSYLLKAKSDTKDQLVTGETKPNDFKVIVVKAVPVSDEWISGLQDALKSEERHESAPDGLLAGLKFKAKAYISQLKEPSVVDKLARINRYLNDSKASKWRNTLQRRYSDIAEKHVAFHVKTGERFDKDFASKVKVTFDNNTGHPAEVYYTPNFADKSKVEVGADESKVLTLVANGVSKDNLDITFNKILPNESVSKDREVLQHQALHKQYKSGVQARAQAAVSKRKAAAAERKRKATAKKRKHLAAITKRVRRARSVTGNDTLSKGLVAFYRFDGNAHDSSGNGHDGEEHNGVVYKPGILGQAVHFDGINDYIFINDSQDLNISQNYTFSLWVKEKPKEYKLSLLKDEIVLIVMLYVRGGKHFCLVMARTGVME